MFHTPAHKFVAPAQAAVSAASNISNVKRQRASREPAQILKLDPAAEAIANADAHLNNVALPLYSAVTERLGEALAALRLAEEALLDAVPTATVRLASRRVRAAIAKATSNQS